MSQENQIKITVLMPCFNAGNYLSESIQSILDQSFKEFELLIVDDGSTDDSVKIVETFADQRIKLLRQQKKGIAQALNLGLEHAKGEFVARFDADDICSTERLEKQYSFLVSNPDYNIIGSAADYIDKDGNFIYSFIPPAISNEQIHVLPLTACPFIHASVMYRKTVVKSIGYNLRAHSFEDHLLWLQLQKMGKMYNMSEPLLSVRINPQSFTIDEKKRSAEFRRIKRKSLSNLQVSEEDGILLQNMISNQNITSVKWAAYHCLLAKKYLWNNYDPLLARKNLKMAIRLNRVDIRDYFLYIFSFFPKKWVLQIYSKSIGLR